MSKKQPIKQKHQPIRTCIATGDKKPKQELVRLVKTPDGEIVVDIYGKTRGRGANITPSLDCFDMAVKKKAINRALKLEKPLEGDELTSLRSVFAEAIEEKNFRPLNRPVTIKLRKEA